MNNFLPNHIKDIQALSAIGLHEGEKNFTFTQDVHLISPFENKSRPKKRVEAKDLHIFETDEYWKSTNLHKYYRYLNSLFRMTLIPKGEIK